MSRSQGDKFILTKELGRLAKWLRILGYDASFYRQDNVSTLIITALREERIILTRNLRISRFPGPKIVIVKSDFVNKQIKQVIRQLKLKPRPKDMFRRCVICNVELKEIAKTRIKSKVPEYVYKTQKDFTNCPRCKKVYWQGTHWGNAKKYLGKI
ncbi:MAG: Mut7-C RNAse domain-containing protein [Candidatus Omnitrophota bacterium]|nr:MAG: Mut7-C RNAse domain-containing protein [Candidatus Omnitrophota bacterium]